MFATPCYAMAVNMSEVTSLFRVTFEATHLQMPVALEMLSHSLMTRVRNLLVLKLLVDESRINLFWIVSHIEFQATSVFRLLCADRDVAAGVCPLEDSDRPWRRTHRPLWG
jgi:hypothetical protein